MNDQNLTVPTVSLWWRRSVFIVLVFGFAILIWMAARVYRDAPPIPEKVLSSGGETIFTREDILSGQQIFLKYGLMENGTIWGHGGYLGPDFSAEYLHTLALDANQMQAGQSHNRTLSELTEAERVSVNAQVRRLLKQNRYDPVAKTLTYTPAEEASYRQQIQKWSAYFAQPVINRGLRFKLIADPGELRQLTSFFAWTAWASVAQRPGKPYSYTNNFPYDPLVGNTPTSASVFWSALSLITLLAGTALVLFAFGKFNYFGWKGEGKHIHPQLIPGVATESQRATIKYFVIVALLFLAQVLVGGATAHYRADPKSFYGIDLSVFFSSNIFRTWHLQLAILWIATAYVGGGLFLATALGGSEPRGQVKGINLLFIALVIVVFGSLLGEMLGIFQWTGKLWFWLGHQGWEYLDLGRGWQILLIIGLLLWLFLLSRAIAPARKDPEQHELSSLFFYTALAIPLFYLPATFFKDTTHFSIVDNWRFWIIHLWVESFFELLLTVMVAVLFYKLGMVSRQTATRVIYLDAILFLGSGIIGTAHHWYWTGQSSMTIAFAAMFSAMEVVPLTLLTLDAWDFFKLTKGRCDICGEEIHFPHKWTFYFMIAVGFWNFVGAGICGFLINLPIVSYFEVGTVLTPLHAHAGLMGVFGMFGLAFMVFTVRQVLPDAEWNRIEKYIHIAFWGLNVGLALMVVLNLFPGGVLQFLDVLENGYWHARSPAYLDQRIPNLIEWLRLPADLIFIVFGVIPVFISVVLAYRFLRRSQILPEKA